MPEPPSTQPSEKTLAHMRGSAAPEGFVALPRPPTPFNRIVRRLSRTHRTRAVELDELRPWVEDSLATFRMLGAELETIEAVRGNFMSRWRIASSEAPADVWCGEVVFSEGGEPLVFMYPDSPWGRLPSPLFALGSQAGVDHMVAHLLEYFAGRDYGEEAACRDQVRLMLARRRPVASIIAVMIAVSHRFHKRIPLSVYRPALRERFLNENAK